ncbi:MAG: hypothetical protein II871_02745 [Clostridia bacterium]|nr:hypothetical protein [Clostridia bacterium]
MVIASIACYNEQINIELSKRHSSLSVSAHSLLSSSGLGECCAESKHESVVVVIIKTMSSHSFDVTPLVVFLYSYLSPYGCALAFCRLFLKILCCRGGIAYDCLYIVNHQRKEQRNIRLFDRMFVMKVCARILPGRKEKGMLKRITAAFAAAMFILTVVCIPAYAASVTYANRFSSWLEGDYYKCQYQFIPAHRGTTDDPFCDYGKHIKQAYVSAHRNSGSILGIGLWDAYSTGRMYSAAAKSKSDTNIYYTPVASIVNTWYAVEYTNYGYTNF